MENKRKFKIEQIIKNIKEEYIKARNEINNLPSVRKEKVVISLNNKNYECYYKDWLFTSLFLIPYSTAYNKGINVFEEDVLEVITGNFSISDYADRMDKIKNFCEDHNIDFSDDLIFILNETSANSGIGTKKIGVSFSLVDIIKEYNKNAEFRDLIDTPKKLEKIKNIKISEVEQMFSEKVKETEKVIKNCSKDFPLKTYVDAGSGVNIKQLTQVLSFVGTKPNINNSVIPVPIKHNFLTGLQTPEDYYVNSLGARKAQITISKMVSPSGHFYRMLNLLTLDTMHTLKVKDCGANKYVLYNVNTKEKLNCIDNRSYLDEETGTLKIINKKEDQNLIGKVIKLRSPMTCKSRLKEGVCMTCYGERLARLLKNKNSGIFAAVSLAEKITQKMLDAKHFSTTTSEKIEWSENFKAYFDFNNNGLTLKDEFIDDYKIKIENVLDVLTSNEIIKIVFDEFKLISPENETIILKANTELVVNLIGEYDLPEETEQIELTLSPEEYGDEITYSYQNDELAASLLKIIGFISRNKILTNNLDKILKQEDIDRLPESIGTTKVKRNFLMGEDVDINKLPYEYNDIKLQILLNKFINSLHRYNLTNTRSVHIEMILSNLLFDENGLSYDFNNLSDGNIVIKNIKDAIIAGPLSKSFSFERFNIQLSDIDTFRKDVESYFDCVFL